MRGATSRCATSRPFAPLLPPRAVTFQIYDLDSAARISPANLRTILASSLRENGVALSDAAIDAMVAGTFATEDANRDGCVRAARLRVGPREFARACCQSSRHSFRPPADAR